MQLTFFIYSPLTVITRHTPVYAVEVGCGAVLCPGTVVGRSSTVYPLVRVRGVIPKEHIVKSEDVLIPKN